MNNGYYYQLLAGLAREGNRFNYPRALKDVVRTGDLDDVKAVEALLAGEVLESSVDDTQGAEYFVQMAEHALLFALYRENYAGFFELHEAVERRLIQLRNAGQVGIDARGWQWYLGFITQAARRLMRNSTVEEFETTIDEIEWDELGKEIKGRIAGIVGFVYLNEESSIKFNKARFWLMKAISDSELSSGLVNYINLAEFFLTNPTADTSKRLEDHITNLENQANTTADPNLARVYRSAVMELQARALICKYGNYDDDHIKIEENLRSVREIERNIEYEGKNSATFVRAFLKMEFSRYYLSLIDADLDKEDIEDLLAMALDDVNEAMSISRRMKDESLRDYLRVRWMSVACERQSKVGERDLKEVVSNLRKGNNHPRYVEGARYLARYHSNQGDSQKAYDVLLDIVKRGQKRIEDGGYYLVVKGMEAVNNVLLEETRQPGVSWMVTEIETYFALITDMIDHMGDHLDTIGGELFDGFQEEMIRMEPASHFNIKVYLRYQYYELKMLRLIAIDREDSYAQRIAESVINALGDENSPMEFIKAEWEEFKDVPNSVRNKILNKCISISKGDLPLAAEHLDFSYRNLRSYITFKEVNRLGFFLNQTDTNMRQMESGIRLMFFDLYKRGTIFEVVFDMPKFLVEHAKSGFSSQDLEEALNIKGTTAKKYIKIMLEIGLIKLERSVGRKHFYKLRKDNVMNRLGQDQRVLMS